MKKENRKEAQKRRAAAREKAARIRKIKKILTWAIPLAIVLVLVLFWAVSALKSSSEDSDAAASTEISATEIDSTAEDGGLNTEAGLVAQEGDTVDIAFTGYVNGETFDGGSSDHYTLELGSGTFIDGFEEGIVGHAVGETFDLELTFPEDYWSEELAGQAVVFTTTLNGIYEE